MTHDERLQQALTRLRDYLTLNRMRHSVEREAVLECVYGSKSHMTPVQVASALEQQGMRVALATVYHALNLLVDCGLVVCNHFAGRQGYYEPAVTDVNHHHLVCTICGKIKEVRDPGVAQLLAGHNYRTFTMAHYALTMYGTCSTCMRRLRGMSNAIKNKDTKQSKQRHK